MFVAKLRGWPRDLPLGHAPPASRVTNTPHPSSEFVTTGEPYITAAPRPPPQFQGAPSQGCAFCGFAQMFNDVDRPLRRHAECFHCPKTLRPAFVPGLRCSGLSTDLLKEETALVLQLQAGSPAVLPVSSKCVMDE